MVTDCQVRKLMKLLNEEQTLCSALTDERTVSSEFWFKL